MADNSSFCMDETPWDISEVDWEAEMAGEDHSVVDGIVDDAFLMSLDDNESVVVPLELSESRGAEREDSLDRVHHADRDLQQSYDDSRHRLPDLYSSVDDFASQVPQPLQRHQSYNQAKCFRQQQQQHSEEEGLPVHSYQQHQHQSTRRFPPARVRLSRTKSAQDEPTRFADRILENAPSFYADDFLMTQQQHSNYMNPTSYNKTTGHSSTPVSPVPNEIHLWESSSSRHHPTTTTAAGMNSNSQTRDAFRVTPEATSSSISLPPDSGELHVQYQRSLQRLGQSMRRSDATRAMVQRVRSSDQYHSPNSHHREDNGVLFPTSNEPADVEEARRRLYHLIHHQS